MKAINQLFLSRETWKQQKERREIHGNYVAAISGLCLRLSFKRKRFKAIDVERSVREIKGFIG
jgi:hypothetical protein